MIPGARRRLVAGNWKLAKTNDEAGRLVRATQESIVARVDEVTRGFSLSR